MLIESTLTLYKKFCLKCATFNYLFDSLQVFFMEVNFCINSFKLLGVSTKYFGLYKTLSGELRQCND